tara:strand:+ start:89 stop:406 length:318 start_codon:yes stop_codon:yes gene_type:complete
LIQREILIFATLIYKSDLTRPLYYYHLSFKNERTAAAANTTRSTTTHGPKHAGINGRINAIPITTNASANVWRSIKFQRWHASSIKSIRSTVEILKSKNGWNLRY